MSLDSPIFRGLMPAMNYPVELLIGLRYTRAKRRNHFISFISISSMLGVMLGVMALITVLSVMNGFHKEVRERILGMVSHATISSQRAALPAIDGQTHKKKFECRKCHDPHSPDLGDA